MRGGTVNTENKNVKNIKHIYISPRTIIPVNKT